MTDDFGSRRGGGEVLVLMKASQRAAMVQLRRRGGKVTLWRHHINILIAIQLQYKLGFKKTRFPSLFPSSNLVSPLFSSIPSPLYLTSILHFLFTVLLLLMSPFLPFLLSSLHVFLYILRHLSFPSLILFFFPLPHNFFSFLPFPTLSRLPSFLSPPSPPPSS